MNKFVKDMLMARSERDGRNPYGSRGGYVSSRRPTRDRGYEEYGIPKNDYRRGSMYPMMDRYRPYDDMDDDYGYDYNMHDYGKSQYGKLSHEDIEHWKKHMENQDGTRGEHFKEDQVAQIARQIGLNPNEYGEDVFGLVVNMVYSDYCGVAKKYGIDRPDFYGELAKAFLHDKDFEGDPEEKVYLYYKCIAEDE